MSWLKIINQKLIDVIRLRNQRFEPYRPTIILDRFLRSTNQKTPFLQTRYL